MTAFTGQRTILATIPRKRCHAQARTGADNTDRRARGSLALTDLAIIIIRLQMRNRQRHRLEIIHHMQEVKIKAGFCARYREHPRMVRHFELITLYRACNRHRRAFNDVFCACIMQIMLRRIRNVFKVFAFQNLNVMKSVIISQRKARIRRADIRD